MHRGVQSGDLGEGGRVLGAGEIGELLRREGLHRSHFDVLAQAAQRRRLTELRRPRGPSCRMARTRGSSSYAGGLSVPKPSWRRQRTSLRSRNVPALVEQTLGTEASGHRVNATVSGVEGSHPSSGGLPWRGRGARAVRKAAAAGSTDPPVPDRRSTPRTDRASNRPAPARTSAAPPPPTPAGPSCGATRVAC